MKRRAQLTIFMALALVLVVGVTILLMVAKEIRVQESTLAVLKVNENLHIQLEEYLTSALEDALTGAIVETIGPQGGYRNPGATEPHREPLTLGSQMIDGGPMYSLRTGGPLPLSMNEATFLDDVTFQEVPNDPYPGTEAITSPFTKHAIGPSPVPYYYLLGKFNIPSEERVLHELTAEVKARFFAILDPSLFEDQGYQVVWPDPFQREPSDPVEVLSRLMAEGEIEEGDGLRFRLNVSLNLQDTSALLHMPVELRSADAVVVISNITITVPLRLKAMYLFATCLVDRVVFDGGQDTEFPYIENFVSHESNAWVGATGGYQNTAYAQCRKAVNDAQPGHWDQDLVIDAKFKPRTKPFVTGGDYEVAAGATGDESRNFRGRVVGIFDERYWLDTGGSWEHGTQGIWFGFQYMIWKCSGNFVRDGPLPDEQRMRVCEYSCALGVPEAVSLGICDHETGCDQYLGGSPPTAFRREDGKVMGMFQIRTADPDYEEWENKCQTSQIYPRWGQLDWEDLEGNVECGVEFMRNARSGAYPYCCPEEHICCESPGHPCCSNPDHPCCRGMNPSSTDDMECPAMDKRIKPESACGIDLCRYDSRWVFDRALNRSVAIPYRVDTQIFDSWCCATNSGDSLGSSALEVSTPCRQRGDPTAPTCCASAYVMDDSMVCGNSKDAFEDERVLMKNAIYRGWDAAIRAHNGRTCSGPNVDHPPENYVEKIHYTIKTGGDYGQSYLYGGVGQSAFSACHSQNREAWGEHSSATLDLPWNSVYLRGSPDWMENEFGCCCDEDDPDEGHCSANRFDPDNWDHSPAGPPPME